MFTAALPKLIGEGRLLSHEIPILVEYLNRIEELNRGLERAGAARAAEQPVLVREEFGRNLEKTRGLLEPDKRFADRYSTRLKRRYSVSREHFTQTLGRLPTPPARRLSGVCPVAASSSVSERSRPPAERASLHAERAPRFGLDLTRNLYCRAGNFLDLSRRDVAGGE